jgi:site-specific recombinase XerD
VIKSKEVIQKFKEEFSYRLSESTIYVYGKAMEQLVSYCNKPFNEITTQEIRNWMVHLEANGYKTLSVRIKLSGLKLFYRYCMEEDLVTKDPAKSIPFPSVEEKLPRYLEFDQLTKLRQIVKENPRLRAMIEVLYSTGIRISELAAMKKDDINWPERIIHIPCGKRKKARIVLFTRTCEEHLKFYLERRKDDLSNVFVNAAERGPVCISTFRENLRNYSKILGFPVFPHILRHTFAAHLAIKGMPLHCIQILLGHIEPHQTQVYARLYSHARKQKYDELM